jgi:hypothetical protein
MDRPAITGQALITRRKAIGGALVAVSPLLFPGRLLAQGRTRHDDSFVLLLKGLYQPVVHGPDLGLSTVDLSDGSYSKTKIYAVGGFPGHRNENDHDHRHEDKPIGDFYVQFEGDLCAYHIPGGSFSMHFDDLNVVFVDDGQGGQFLEGTADLTILEATGIYKPFVGGHNLMVDKLHFLAPGDGSGGADEYCYISAP